MRRSRPSFDPNYGISSDDEGMLPWSWADERLAASRNYWIVTAGADGEPSAAPVWGVWADGAVYFGTAPGSRKGRNLAHDPRVVVHLESGDEAVILHGEAEVVDVSESVLDAYETKYGYRPPATRLYCLRPRRALAWLEADYPRTATRFDFDA
ncbi:MAG TPA: pyridoxamine 5'-phosphate oxidase family protein [Gaiellaceae bacterium]|nr:pyridoxamine 5'-phosphate oxidase family protein [Gaiellaceae bacterium]